MAYPFQQYLDPFLQGTAQGFGQRLGQRPAYTFGQQLGQGAGSFLSDPNRLLGAGLIGASALTSRDPGGVGQARQFLRNRFTSPTGIVDQFSAQLPGIQSAFQPMLDQQANRQIENLTQRYKGAFPATAGAQGPEFQGLSRLITDQILPQQRDFYGKLGLDLMNAQGNAAGTLLLANQQNPTAQMLGTLGGLLLTRDQGRGGFGGGSAGAGGEGPMGAGYNPGPYGSPPLGASPGTAGQLQQLIQTRDLAGLSRLLGTAVSVDPQMAGGGLSGIVATTSHGSQIPIEAITLPGGSPASGIGGALPSAAGPGGGLDFGLPGPGLLGPAGLTGTGLLSSAGSGAGGYFVGRQIGERMPNEATGTTAGAASGAAIGFAVGGPVGAVIGGLAGGLGGFSGAQAQIREKKNASIAQETAQTESQRPAVFANISDFTNRINTVVPDVQATGAALQPRLQALIQQGNPAILALAGEAQSILGGVRGGGASPAVTLADSFSLLNADLQSFRDRMTSGQDNPESLYNLLRSKEVGKFGPGTKIAQNFMDTANREIAFYNKLVQTIQQAGG